MTHEVHTLDRRTSPRTCTRVAVQLTLRGFPEPLRGYAVDIGPSGICVSTYSRLPMCDISAVSFALDGEMLCLPAEGRWQRLDNGGRGMVAGLMFRDVDSVVALRLREFVLDSALETAAFMLDATVLDGLDIDDAVDAALLTRAADYPMGGRIYEQGALRTRGDSFFIVQRGAVVQEVGEPGQGRLIVSRIGVGGVFAGLPLLAGAPHAESAIAETELSLLEIDPFSFAALEQTRPRVSRGMIRAALRQRAFASRSAASCEALPGPTS